MIASENKDVVIHRQCPTRLLLVSLWLGLLLGSGNTEAQLFRAQEYFVKMGYLYNFAKFVAWPPQTSAQEDAPITLCLLGKNPFGQALASLRGKTAQGRPIKVRQLKSEAASRECHILFIASSEQQRLADILSAIGALPVLTISDIPGFARAGGMVGLVETNKRIVFEVNLPKAQQADIVISAQLLKISTIVSK